MVGYVVSKKKFDELIMAYLAAPTATTDYATNAAYGMHSSSNFDQKYLQFCMSW